MGGHLECVFTDGSSRSFVIAKSLNRILDGSSLSLSMPGETDRLGIFGIVTDIRAEDLDSSINGI